MQLKLIVFPNIYEIVKRDPEVRFSEREHDAAL